MTTRRVSADELAAWLAGDEPPQLVAVMTEWQFRTAHIPRSRRFATLAAALQDLSREAPVVVYCAGDPCPAARWAARLLSTRGFSDVVVFAGGLAEWTDTAPRNSP